MLTYLSKFVLQMLPTISATVIGAYIVATWINPKTPPEPVKIAAGAQVEQAAGTAPEGSPAQHAAAAPAEAKSVTAAEAERPVKAANASDNIRIIPIVKQPAQALEASLAASATEAVAAVDEPKDANELARAAIQRLRGSSEPARAAAEPAKPVAASARLPEARAGDATPGSQAPLLAAPPLPPAVSIGMSPYPHGEPDQASLTEPDRMSPPGEIPLARHPLRLQASHRVAENPSLADDFLSATRSFFRAITPPAITPP